MYSIFKKFAGNFEELYGDLKVLVYFQETIPYEILKKCVRNFEQMSTNFLRHFWEILNTSARNFEETYKKTLAKHFEILKKFVVNSQEICEKF